jgi:hypothetical protein
VLFRVEVAAEDPAGKKMTAWVGPHPDGQEKGEKELKSQEGRALIFVLSLPFLLDSLNVQISCHFYILAEYFYHLKITNIFGNIIFMALSEKIKSGHNPDIIRT